jgi:hypothetical protein
LRKPILFAFVLSFVPSLALADEPSLVEWTTRRVEDGLVKPLVKLEGNRFSRSRPAPRERRVRVLQPTATLDKQSRAFVPFAVDVRFGDSQWHEGDVVGCAYRGSGNLYVKVGDGYRPAAFLLGKNVQAVPGACEAAPSRA